MTEGTLEYREYGAESALIRKGIDYQDVMNNLGLGNVAEIRDAYKAQRVGLGANYDKLILAYAGDTLEKRTDKIFAIAPLGPLHQTCS